MWLLNAFSIQMLPDCRGTIRFIPISEEDARSHLADGFESAIGHELTARLLSKRLNLGIEARRVEIALTPGETAIIAQLRLPRGAEGILPSEEELARTPVSYVRVEVLDS
ncbi:DUF1874 domain-containing protein [Candidatus Poribacteria bacterium]|nr:DUF1874 domain-containing protein [Candidatus Poribacteria bacterium]